MRERIAKRMAASGACSRRTAEKIIAEGRVCVNGVRIDTPATLVSPHDTITIDGEEITAPNTARLWMYHKPKGLITSHHDPEGRPTVFAHLPKHLPRVISVGRLDLNTEGLLLLTTCGELARSMELPSSGFKRTYRVRVDGAMHPEALKEIRRGTTIDGVRYQPAEIVEDTGASGRNRWLTITLTEGKNREIRKLCEYAGVRVSRLIRTHYGPYALADLPVGEVREILL